jgi:hypothetical protein
VSDSFPGYFDLWPDSFFAWSDHQSAPNKSECPGAKLSTHERDTRPLKRRSDVGLFIRLHLIYIYAQFLLGALRVFAVNN